MVIGYVRVSCAEQNESRQMKQLQDADCDVIYHEKISGATMDRPELRKMLDALQSGDSLNHAIDLYQTGKYTVKQICAMTNVSRSALYREIQQREAIKV